MDAARRFPTQLARELKTKDLLNIYEGADVAIRISAGYAQADKDSLIKEVLAKVESKDSRYLEFELNYCPDPQFIDRGEKPDPSLAKLELLKANQVLTDKTMSGIFFLCRRCKAVKTYCVGSLSA